MRELGILVTGATDGHGRALAKALAAEGATLLIHGRDDGALDQVRSLAGRVEERGRLDALVNNAGIWTTVGGERGRAVSTDGYELRFAVDEPRAYGQSKLAQIMFTFDLAQELDPGEVTANCLHPATYMPTTMVRAAGVDPISSLEDGVRATLRLVADPALDGVSGQYFNGLRPATPHPQAADAEARRRLRMLSDEMCGLAQQTS